MRRLTSLLVVLALLGAGISALGQEAEPEETYVVQTGDNLYRISLRFGISVRDLAARNTIENVNFIYAGQTLFVPINGEGGTSITPMPPRPVNGYVIQRGDTLSTIARRFGITTRQLADANNLTNLNMIYAGRTLLIPANNVVVEETDTPRASAEDSTSQVAATPQPTTAVASAATEEETSTPTAPPDPTATATPTQVVIAQAAIDLPSVNSTLAEFNLGGQVLQADYPFAQQMRDTNLIWAKRTIIWDGEAPASDLIPEINAARNAGFRLLLTVIGERNDLAANPTRYYDNFANYLGDLAAFGVDAIQVWHEPNVAENWPSGRISGQSYTQMLTTAYTAIKAQSPNTLVISAAPEATGRFGGECTASGCDDNVFINQMRNANAADVLDCVGLQYTDGAVPPLSTSGAPVASPQHYSWYYGVLVNLYRGQFPDSPLCITGIGYLTVEDLDVRLPSSLSWGRSTTVAQHASWLAEAAQVAQSGTIVRMFIIDNVDGNTQEGVRQLGYAIVRPDGSCPACAALLGVLES